MVCSVFLKCRECFCGFNDILDCLFSWFLLIVFLFIKCCVESNIDDIIKLWVKFSEGLRWEVYWKLKGLEYIRKGKCIKKLFIINFGLSCKYEIYFINFEINDLMSGVSFLWFICICDLKRN